jgi:hypothetical protein
MDIKLMLGSQGVMNLEKLVTLLEHSWGRLQAKLGERWPEFLSGYQDIIAGLPPEPSWQHLESAADGLEKLLSRYTYGRELLDSYREFEPIRVLGIQPPSQTLSDKEYIQQICNRLRKLSDSASTLSDNPQPDVKAARPYVSERGAMLKDLTLWRWQFFVKWRTQEEDAQKAQHWQEFCGALKSAVGWAGGSPVAYAMPAYRRQTSARIESIPWQASQGLLRTLEARALLDAFYIQTGCFQEGAADPETVLPLKEAAWHGESQAHTFLGEAVCLTGEVHQDLAEQQAHNIAQAVLAQWFGEPPRQLESVQLACGFLAVPIGVQEEAWVLLVRDADAGRQQAAQLVHRLLPLCLLAWLKGLVIMRTFEDDLLPQAAKSEADLDARLRTVSESIKKRKIGLNDLEEASEDIAALQAAFIEYLSQCQEMLETLQANAENIELVLKDPLLHDQQTRLDELWVAPLRLATRQLQTDLHYLSITQGQSERMQRSIETIAEVHSARWNRRITLLLGIFAAFEFLQVFPEIPMGWRVLSSVLVPTFVAVLIWLLSRE